MGGFIVGLPGESQDSVMETLDWLQSEDCPLDAYSINPFFLPPSKAGLHQSKISMHPERYGYTRAASDAGSYLDWQNEHMNFQQARRIVAEFQSSETYRKRNRILGGFVMYSRMRNLGYTMEDLFGELMIGGYWYDEYERRWEARRSSYFIQLADV